MPWSPGPLARITGRQIMDECNNIYNQTICKNVLSIEECQLVINYFSQPVFPSLVVNSDLPEINRIKDKILAISKKVNLDAYGFNLTAMSHLQLLENSGDKQSYWRSDFVAGQNQSAKLTMLVNLSDPNDYKGGLISWFPESKDITGLQSQGNLIVFPAYIPYRFEKIEEGKQFLLLVFALGPSFT
jgi:PKHD-type hydroxylase